MLAFVVNNFSALNCFNFSIAWHSIAWHRCNIQKLMAFTYLCAHLCIYSSIYVLCIVVLCFPPTVVFIKVLQIYSERVAVLCWYHILWLELHDACVMLTIEISQFAVSFHKHKTSFPISPGGYVEI